MNKRDFWIGIGIGAAVGIPAGFVTGNLITKKYARRDMERVQRNAYLKGKREAEADVITVDSSDPEAIQKAIDEHMGKSEEKAEDDSDSHSQPKNNAEKAPKGASGEAGVKAETPVISESVYEEEDLPTRVSKALPMRIEGQYAIFIGAAGTEIRYPKSLVIGPDGQRYDDLKLRNNFRTYEPDVQKLRLIWNCMGWGTYIPDLDGLPTAEDIDNWDLSLGDEPEVKTEERRKMVENIRKNQENPNAKPQIITRREFEEENFLKQTYFDYYAIDNVFTEHDDISQPIDAFTLFGTNDGKSLFGMKKYSENDEDPDIVYVKNFKMNCVAEITRYPKKSFESLKDGTAFIGGGM